MLENTQAVILAGGKGSRLGEITKVTPKPLIDIGGYPFIFYIINKLLGLESKFHNLTGYKHEKFENLFSITFIIATYP